MRLLSGESRDPFIRFRAVAGWLPAFAGTTDLESES